MKFLIAITFFVFFTWPFATVSYAGNFTCVKMVVEDCAKCHKKTISHDMSLQFVHKPFRQKSCQCCHMEFDAQTANTTIEAMVKSRQKKLLYGDDKLVNEHWILVPKASINGEIILKLRSQQGEKDFFEIRDEALKNAVPIAKESEPPIVSEVKKSLQRGIFWRLNLAWTTNELASTEVRIEDSRGHTELIGSPERLSFKHKIAVYDLKKGKNYRIWIRSRDVFGNVADYGPITVVPQGAYTPKKESEEESPKIDPLESDRTFKCRYRIMDAGESFVIKAKCNEPSYITVFSLKTNGIRKRCPKDHPACAPLSYSGTVSCLNCHRKDYCLHPRNVTLKKGMNKDGEYPLTESHTIMCATCHNPHSSRYSFLLRKPGRAELCMGCHTKW